MAGAAAPQVDATPLVMETDVKRVEPRLEVAKPFIGSTRTGGGRDSRVLRGRWRRPVSAIWSLPWGLVIDPSGDREVDAATAP